MKKGNLEYSEDINRYVLDNSLRESEVLSNLRTETNNDPDSIMH